MKIKKLLTVFLLITTATSWPNEKTKTHAIKKKTQTTFCTVQLKMKQENYQNTLRPIQNKVVYWPQGQEVYMSTGIPLTAYKANVRMVSGGDSTDLNSTLIIPDDYVPIMVEYIKAQLAFERSRPIDTSNDGVDNNN